MKHSYRIKALMLAFCLLAAMAAPGAAAAPDVWDGSVASSFAKGSGTESDPYQIADAAQLALLSKLVNEGNEDYNAACYELTADIDLGGSEDNQWTPIGKDEGSDYCPFRGQFDGKGHSITGLYISGWDDNVGLFGCTARSTVRNVTVGGFVRGKANVGGIVGKNATGKVINCRNDAAVDGAYQVGGVVGYNHAQNASGAVAEVTECVNTGCVTVSSSKAGGVVGENYTYKGASRVTRCVNTGQVAAKSSSCQYIGGVVGYSSADSYGTAEVADCYNTGVVARLDRTGLPYGKYVGGVVGRNRATGSSYVFSSGYVRAAASVVNCYNVGVVEGGDYVRGVIGSTSFNSGVVDGCTVKGCRFLKTDSINADLTALYRSGGTGSVKVDDETGPISEAEFGTWDSFVNWDRDIWTMGTDLDPGISGVTARPVLISVDEPEMSVPVTGVSIDIEELTLISGETAVLTAEVTPEDASDKTVSWESSAPDVVKVDESGRLTAVASGSAKITASAGGKSASCDVTVVSAKIEGLSYSQGKAAVRVTSSDPATAVFAAYEEGRYIGGMVKMLSAATRTELSFDVPEGADTVRVFVLDNDYRPLILCGELSVK
ncbi:MAG: Ig domain-containing protein [Clostridia bacterium]|nr:Ig domain-containing protein [Clostridia bacterium]